MSIRWKGEKSGGRKGAEPPEERLAKTGGFLQERYALGGLANDVELGGSFFHVNQLHSFRQ